MLFQLEAKQGNRTKISAVYPRSIIMNFNIKYKQVGIQDDSHAIAQLPDVAASTHINSRPNILGAFAQRKCVSPMTFCQKIYQVHALKFPEALAQAIDTTSLKRINNFLDNY